MDMNRRHFCKVAALAAGAIGLGGLESGAALVRPRSLRVTVLRCECYEDIQSLYLDDPETGRCDIFRPGQTFEIRGGECPEGFCRHAFNTIMNYVEATSGQLCSEAVDGCFIASCPDGSRPVIFRIEAQSL